MAEKLKSISEKAQDIIAKDFILCISERAEISAKEGDNFVVFKNDKLSSGKIYAIIEKFFKEKGFTVKGALYSGDPYIKIMW